MASLTRSRFRARCQSLWILAVALSIGGSLAAARDARAGSTIVGMLSTEAGAEIPSADLAAWINADITANGAQSLIDLTECFGGNTAQAFAAGPGNSNNSGLVFVISATAPGELAYYGGFDSASAAALKPGNTITAQTVFDLGSAGKDPKETPTSVSILPLNNFSLVPSAAAGPVQGRQVLVYAGVPRNGAGTATDSGIRDTIAANFKGQVGTTIQTIGGAGGGANGWQAEGNAAGLKHAIDLAGTAIKLAANPSQQQFVLDVTDHGGVRNVASDLNRSAPTLLGVSAPTPTVSIPVPVSPGIAVGATPAPLVNFVLLTKGFQTFTGLAAFNGSAFPTPGGDTSGNLPPTAAQLASPRYSILIPFSDNAAITPATNLRPNATSWILELRNTVTGGVLDLADSFQTVYNPSGGNNFNALDDLTKDEGIRVNFLVPPNIDFAASFFNATFDVYLANYSGNAYNVGEFAQDNPSISPLSVPEPTSLALCILPVTLVPLAALRPRSRLAGRVSTAPETA